MVQVLAFAAAVAVSVSGAAACPPSTSDADDKSQESATTASASGDPAPAVVVTAASADAAAHCAKSEQLVGSNCSYTTGMMARRVMEEGQDWRWTGELVAGANNLTSSVAVPFEAGGGTHVIANELLETLSSGGHARGRHAFTGKLLEVDGVRYVVLTSFKDLAS